MLLQWLRFLNGRLSLLPIFDQRTKKNLDFYAKCPLIVPPFLSSVSCHPSIRPSRSGERRGAVSCPSSPASAGIVTPPSVIRTPSKFATLGLNGRIGTPQRRRWIWSGWVLMSLQLHKYSNRKKIIICCQILSRCYIMALKQTVLRRAKSEGRQKYLKRIPI